MAQAMLWTIAWMLCCCCLAAATPGEPLTQPTASTTRNTMGPPLPPSQTGTSLTGVRPKIQIECFVDLICPFSCKLYNTLYEHVLPALKDDTNIQFVLHQVIQPWHPQGTAVHEAALACKRVAPDHYTAYVHAIYKAYTAGQFKDPDTWDKTRLQLYDELLALLPKSVDAAQVKALLLPKDPKSSYGNAVTQEVKWMCKLHRTRGVHVTPTVFVNGLEASVVSSGWTKDDWLKFLQQKGEDMFQGA